MIGNSPSQTGLCSLGQARVVVPSLVMEFIGTIRQSAPHQRWDRVDHHPIFVFGFRRLGIRLPELNHPLALLRGISDSFLVWRGGSSARYILGFRTSREVFSELRFGKTHDLSLRALILPRANIWLKPRATAYLLEGI
jgi:hypothetical protein